MGGRAAAALGATVLFALGACGRPSAPPAAPRAVADAGFLSPPTLVAASWTSARGVRLTGRAPPDATVRLQAPDGRALGVTADAAGGWTAELPAAAEPQLFAFSAEVAGRTVRSEGALATAPPGSAVAALVARAGAASLPAGSGAAAASPALQVIDFDGGGGIAAAGRALPGVTLKLSVDGGAIGAGGADGTGRFGLPGVGRPLAPGAHRVRVEAPGGAAEATVDTAPAAPLADIAFRTARTAGGWRVDWALPGGGVQSLLLLDAPGAVADGGVRP